VAGRLETGRRLYTALQAGDAAVLRELLAEEFVGHLTAGLPKGFGRTYEDLESMLRGWGAVNRLFRMVPEIDLMLEAGDYLVVRGWYVGQVTTTSKPMRASFAHFWRFNDERIVSLEQVTDSAVWHDALRT